MKIDSLDQIENEFVLTIGNFDGAHLGHKHLIDTIRKLSNGLSVAVMTFAPHPKIVLQSKQNYLLKDSDSKGELLEKLGVDFIIEIPFTRDFSTLSPVDFINRYILVTKKLKAVYLGHDFNFGSNKEGGLEDFKKATSHLSIHVEKLDSKKIGVETISSSLVRECLLNGDIENANRYLGRSYSLRGTVVKGAGRGKLIGFPTANIDFIKERLVPKVGVYATIAEYKGIAFKSLTNVGYNPTFGGKHISVETNILDFNNDIYGEKITIKFIKRIRDEKKFSDVNALVEQIRQDVHQRLQLGD